MVFDNGVMVEVRIDESGFEGAWFPAKIESYLGDNRYIVEYQTLQTIDESELLKEEVRDWDIRPIPPQVIPKACQYEVNDEVDTWYNEGWWSGRVYKVNKDYLRYGVYFKTTGEILEFDHNELRPCQVWINRKWSRIENWLSTLKHTEEKLPELQGGGSDVWPLEKIIEVDNNSLKKTTRSIHSPIIVESSEEEEDPEEDLEWVSVHEDEAL